MSQGAIWNRYILYMHLLKAPIQLVSALTDWQVHTLWRSSNESVLYSSFENNLKQNEALSLFFCKYVKGVWGSSCVPEKARSWEYSKHFLQTSRRNRNKCWRFCNQKGCRTPAQESNEAFFTHSLRVPCLERANYKAPSSKNKIVCSVGDRKNWLVSSNTFKELESKSKIKFQKTETSNDTTGTVLLFDNEVFSSLPVRVASKKVL